MQESAGGKPGTQRMPPAAVVTTGRRSRSLAGMPASVRQSLQLPAGPAPRAAGTGRRDGGAAGPTSRDRRARERPRPRIDLAREDLGPQIVVELHPLGVQLRTGREQHRFARLHPRLDEDLLRARVRRFPTHLPGVDPDEAVGDGPGGAASGVRRPPPRARRETPPDTVWMRGRCCSQWERARRLRATGWARSCSREKRFRARVGLGQADPGEQVERGGILFQKPAGAGRPEARIAPGRLVPGGDPPPVGKRFRGDGGVLVRPVLPPGHAAGVQRPSGCRRPAGGESAANESAGRRSRAPAGAPSARPPRPHAATRGDCVSRMSSAWCQQSDVAAALVSGGLTRRKRSGSSRAARHRSSRGLPSGRGRAGAEAIERRGQPRHQGGVVPPTPDPPRAGL